MPSEIVSVGWLPVNCFSVIAPRRSHLVTRADTSPDGSVPGEGGPMESVITAVVTGVLTLVGVLVSNSRSQAVIEVKLDNLAAKVEKHNSMIERTYALEQDVAVLKRDVEAMGKAACDA